MRTFERVIPYVCFAFILYLCFPVERFPVRESKFEQDLRATYMQSRIEAVSNTKCWGWVHPSQATEASHAMLQSVRSGALIHAPALWPLEVATALKAGPRLRLPMHCPSLSPLRLASIACTVDFR